MNDLRAQSFEPFRSVGKVYAFVHSCRRSPCTVQMLATCCLQPIFGPAHHQQLQGKMCQPLKMRQNMRALSGRLITWLRTQGTDGCVVARSRRQSSFRLLQKQGPESSMDVAFESSNVNKYQVRGELKQVPRHGRRWLTESPRIAN